jgi:hypothetical protein
MPKVTGIIIDCSVIELVYELHCICMVRLLVSQNNGISCKGELAQKSVLSLDFMLQFACKKPELLVSHLTMKKKT